MEQYATFVTYSWTEACTVLFHEEIHLLNQTLQGERMTRSQCMHSFEDLGLSLSQ